MPNKDQKLNYCLDANHLYLSCNRKELNRNVYADIYLPDNYEYSCELFRVVLSMFYLEEDIDIKKAFFKLLNQMPGDLYAYPQICLHINDDRIEVKNGELIDYYNSRANENISRVLGSDGKEYYRYYYLRNTPKNAIEEKLYISVDNVLYNPQDLDGYALYVSGFISQFNNKFLECQSKNLWARLKKRKK